MHTIPICHWSGAAILPLLDLDYRTPRTSPHPTTQAELVALGLPAATAMWNCQELASPITDKIGAVNLSSGGVAPLFGQRASGIFWNGDFTGTQKKAVEGANGSTNTLVAANAGLLDVLLDDMALWVEFRIKPQFMSSTRPFIGKFDAPSLTGYRVRISNLGALSFQPYDGAVAITPTVTDLRFVDGGWHRALCVLDRTAGFVRIFTEYGTQSIAIGALGSITTVALFSFFAQGATTGAGVQISQAIVWIGAGVTGMGAAHFNLLNVHGTDPDVVPLNVTTHTNRISDLCGYTAGFGVHLADWSTNLLPIGWNPLLNGGAGGLGLGVWRAATSLIDYSDDFSNAAWVKSGTCTVSIAAADLNDSPRGMREAAKMTVAAGAGYMSRQTATAAATCYTFDVFIKRHSTAGANVNGNIEMYNATGAVSVATQAFVATAEWQRIKLTAVTQAGQILTEWRINITDNNGAMAVSRATVVAGYMSTPIFSHGAAGSFTLTDFRLTGTAAGAYQKGAQGEIDVTFAANDGSNGVQRTLLNELSFALLNRSNVHELLINNIDLHEEEIYNNASGLDHVAFGTVLIMTREHTMRYRWDTAGLPSGSASEIIEDGAAPISGSLLPWATGDTVDYFFFGQDETVARSSMATLLA